MLGQNAEEFEGDLPMMGVLAADQALQAGEVQALGFHLVEKPRQLGGEADRLVLARPGGRLPGHGRLGPRKD